MNFSNEIKSEITAQPFDNVCCRMAVLSAIIRTSGSIFFSGGQAGVEIAVDNVDVLEFIVSNFEKIYSIKPSFYTFKKRYYFPLFWKFFSVYF